MPSGFSLRSLFGFGLASPRRAVRTAALAAAIAAGSASAWALSPALPPAEAGAGEIENSKFQFEGVLSRPEYAHALPGERFYPTMLLDKGSKVTVVGAKGDWLKIVPPDGSFSYVNKAFVERFGNGKQGRATAANLLVKAGSSLQPQMWITQTKLNPKDVVEIIGEDDQFYKIKPPAGAYVYIPKDAVPVPKQEVADAPPAPPAPEAPVKPAPQPPEPQPERIARNTPEAPQPLPAEVPPTVPPATGPVVTRTPTPGAPTPAPEAPEGPVPAGLTIPGQRPENGDIVPPEMPITAAEAIPALTALEAQFKEATQKPLAEQPLADLTAGYERIGSVSGLTDAAKRVVEIRLATLKVRSEALEQLKATQEQQKTDQSKLDSVASEREELQSVLKKVEIQQFTAVGSLRPSSLQVARTTLYRLTDPRTGRTLAYVWGIDPKVGTMVDQFVGVKGQLQTDGRLQFKVINPTAIEAIDPANVNKAYAAEIVPPSLMPRNPQATAVTPEP